MAQNKPTIILVPGAFHKALHFYKLAMYLTMAGHTVSLIDLPSTTSDEPRSPVYETDVSTISNAIREFTEVGRDVVLVMHDYAGNPGTKAACGFESDHTLDSKDGASGGRVVKLIYLAAWLPVENQSYSSLPWPAKYEHFAVTSEKVR